MEQATNSSQAKVLELLHSLPHPGRLLLDFVGDGISGFVLRPKSIPQKLTGNPSELPWSVDCYLFGKENGKIFENDKTFVVDVRSEEWQKWVSGKSNFIVREDDAGKEIDVVLERQKNFNKNILHEFLDQFPITLSIDRGYRESLLSPDNYPMYFWDKSVAVSGSASSGNMQKILAAFGGVSHPAICYKEKLFLNYWHFVPYGKDSYMQAVLKWHRVLIALLHLMKRDGVDIPINFEEMEKNCWDEINAVGK